MLQLTRKIGERIYIGDDIVLTVLDIQNGKARLGIAAPLPVGIWREEVLPEHRLRVAGAANAGNSAEADGV